MKLFITTALTAAALASGTFAADNNARYEATLKGLSQQDTEATEYDADNSRFEAVTPNLDTTPEMATKGEVSPFEDPSISATPSASQGHIEYLQDKQRKQDLYR